MITASKYVIDIMTPNPVVVGPETVTSSAERLAEQRNVHDLLVVEGYRLAGVVCLCDLRRASATGGRVRDFMRGDPVTIDDQETGAAAEHLMDRRAVGCLPVVDWSGTLRGVVTHRDLVKAGVVGEGKESTHGYRSCEATHEGSPVRDTVGSRDYARDMPMVANDAGYLAVGGC